MWNIKLSKVLKNFGLAQSKCDPCIYYVNKNTEILIVALYVDDMLLLSNASHLKDSLKNYLSEVFYMKDIGQESLFLGLRITRNEDKISIDQEQYIKKMLQRFDMENCKPVKTPMNASLKLSSDMSPKTKKEEEEMKKIPYQELIGSLLFCAQVSRPDISFAVNYLSRYNSNPGQQHWSAAKRVLRYLKGSSHRKLSYQRDSNFKNLTLIGYCDADFAGDLDKRKSTSGFVYLLQGGAVSWNSKKQSIVALSTAEAEFVSLSSAIQEEMWIRELLRELTVINKTLIYCDNQSALKMAICEKPNPRTRHIDVRYCFVRETVVEKQEVNLEYLPTEEMVADALTKPLPALKNVYCSEKMGLS